MTFEETKAIKDSLVRTWGPFFGQYGRLLPIQVKAIPMILAGENVVLQSPTASGKTEAVVAPIVERILMSERGKPSFLYISPTRALIYDLYERLSLKMSHLDLEIAVRTGDKHQFRDEAPQDIVITTPESLDSMLCRSRDSLRNIRFVVLDELHLLDSNYRGDQLRLDLARLEEVIDEKVQYCALSATFNDPGGVAGRYFASPVPINVPGRRDMIYEIRPGSKPGEIAELLINLRDEGVRKILFFCNSRKEVESLGVQLRELEIWPGEGVFVHHGSLSFKEREKTEKSMKHMKAVVCVATMSLEVGVDIGDIDVVVLVGPPPSVSSLLQRVGRGNRRLGTTRAIGLRKTEDELSEFEFQFKAAINGEIEGRSRGPCLSVAVQQIFSYLYQNQSRGVDQEKMIALMSKLPLDEEDVNEILLKLEREDFLHLQSRRILPCDKLLGMGERGFIHSNIPTTPELKVIDRSTGKVVGEIASFEQMGRSFILSGRRWGVISIKENMIIVAPVSDAGAALPTFSPRSQHGRYTSLLPRELLSKCCRPLAGESSP